MTPLGPGDTDLNLRIKDLSLVVCIIPQRMNLDTYIHARVHEHAYCLN